MLKDKHIYYSRNELNRTDYRNIYNGAGSEIWAWEAVWLNQRKMAFRGELTVRNLAIRDAWRLQTLHAESQQMHIFFSFMSRVTVERKVICYIAQRLCRTVSVLGKSLCIFVNASDCAGRKGTRRRKGWGINYKRESHHSRWCVSKSCTFQMVVFAPCV